MKNGSGLSLEILGVSQKIMKNYLFEKRKKLVCVRVKRVRKFVARKSEALQRERKATMIILKRI